MTRRDLLEAYRRVSSSIDDALDELEDASLLDRPFVKLRLRALVQLRRQIRARLNRAND